jgi:hypothetical protein
MRLSLFRSLLEKHLVLVTPRVTFGENSFNNISGIDEPPELSRKNDHIL